MRTRLLAITTVLTISVGPASAAWAHEGQDHGGVERRNAPSRTAFRLRLSGAQVPGGGDPAGRGTGVVRLYPDDGVVCLEANWRDVAGQVTAIHIHYAPPGRTGPTTSTSSATRACRAAGTASRRACR